MCVASITLKKILPICVVLFHCLILCNMQVSVIMWIHVVSERHLLSLVITVCFVIMFLAGKLLGRSNKIAYNLLHKVGPKGDPGVKPGDRVSVILLNY